ncbi:MAG: hypothetical protein RL385_1292 [Pseudomonadota bacterium]|jgi:ABC-2 type transport system permease protein
MTHPFLVYLRLELADARRSKWAIFATSVYVLLGAAFVWLGLRESTVLGFTGLSRVLLNVAHTVILVFPLLVLVGTHAAVVRGKTSGFCELMLVQPVRRSTWLLALLASRMVILIGPFVLLLLGGSAASALGLGEPELLRTSLTSLSICASLVSAYIGLGLLVSASARSAERAIVWALAVFAMGAALHDMLLITALMRTSLPPQLVFALAALNPCEAARVGVLSSVDPELSVLGPVGFWLANYLGQTRALALAIGYPLLISLLSTGAAWLKLRRADLVA